jgi:hypothetical protein
LAMNAFYWGLRLTQPCAAEMQHYDGGCWKTTTSPPRRSAWCGMRSPKTTEVAVPDPQNGLQHVVYQTLSS